MTRLKFFSLLSFILLACGTLLISCDGSKKMGHEEGGNPEEEVRHYGKYFIDKLSANQQDSLKASYPDIAKADSFVPIKSDTIMVVETAPGQYDITLAEGISLKVTRSNDGNISVTESKGLFAFPADKIEIAKKTGLWDDNLNDAKLANRMNDKEFFEYLKKKKVSKNNIISIGKTIDDGMDFSLSYDNTRKHVILTNNTDVQIDGKDYKTTWHTYVWDSEGNTTEAGKSIAPHGTVKISWVEGGDSGQDIKGIKWNLSDKQLQEKFASYTGQEYQDYLNSKK